MSFLKNTSIRTKMLCVILPLCIIGFSAAAFMGYRYKQADTAYSDFISTDDAAVVDFTRSGRYLTQTAYEAYQIMAYDANSAGFQSILEGYQENKADLLAGLTAAKQKMPDQVGAMDNFLARAREVIALTDRAVELGRLNKTEEATISLAKADAAITPMIKDMLNFGNDRMLATQKESDELTDQTNATVMTALVGILLIFSLSIAAAIMIISKGVTGPIARLCNRMTSLARGETAAPIDGEDRSDEIGEMARAVRVFQSNAIERIRLEHETEAARSEVEQERNTRERQKAIDDASIQFAVAHLTLGLSRLAEGDVTFRLLEPFTASLDAARADFNNSVGKLQSALLRVSENASGIEGGADEIKAAAEDLAKRTEQQAAAVEETAAALEQITTTVRDSTRRAQEAGEFVSRAKAGAEQSGGVVRRAVVAMERIAKSSDEISSIIGVIDEIAFQTNLLALNAGVEAARAGDAGKGFAVVAQEVRELAQRSANAAKEIKSLITTSNAQVREGVQLVDDTGKALETIVSEVQQINQHVAAIVDSAEEQSSGLQQIDTAVNQMDQDTQKNAAMVEETTAASHSLAKEVRSLNHLLAQFALSDSSPQSSATVRPAIGNDQSVPSTVHTMGRKLTAAFSGSAARDTWEDF